MCKVITWYYSLLWETAHITLKLKHWQCMRSNQPKCFCSCTHWWVWPGQCVQSIKWNLHQPFSTRTESKWHPPRAQKPSWYIQRNSCFCFVHSSVACKMQRQSHDQKETMGLVICNREETLPGCCSHLEDTPRPCFKLPGEFHSSPGGLMLIWPNVNPWTLTF